jgi:hypothetical protein
LLCLLHLYLPARSLPATYTLIHSFLKKHSHDKAAQALRKAVKGVVTITEDTKTDGPQLDEILKQWKELSTSSLKAASAVSTCVHVHGDML